MMHKTFISRELIVGTAAFLSVTAVASVLACVAPAVAYFVGAPKEIVWWILSLSICACLPCGLSLAYATSLYARRHVGLIERLKFASVVVVILPLATHPQTSGPLVKYTGVAIAMTIVLSLLLGSVMRLFENPVKA
jgi:hypothetical protein